MATTTSAELTRDPEQHFFSETFGDFSEELETAREQGKKGILIMFEMDECPFCHRMRDRVLNQPDVQEYFRENFLAFAIDIEGDIEVTDFAGETTTMKDLAFKQYRVQLSKTGALYRRDARQTGVYVARPICCGRCLCRAILHSV